MSCGRVPFLVRSFGSCASCRRGSGCCMRTTRHITRVRTITLGGTKEPCTGAGLVRRKPEWPTGFVVAARDRRRSSRCAAFAPARDISSDTEREVSAIVVVVEPHDAGCRNAS
jgi:hypothetical protein